MKLTKNIRNLCNPAFVYFSVSMVMLILMVLQNLGNTNTFYLGSYTSYVVNATLILFLKFIYILFWTWILNLICKDGHTGIAWFLLLFPFVLFFFVLLYIIM